MDRKTNRRGKPTRLNSLTEKLIGPAMMARGFSHSRIVTEWPQVASTAADWSEPASITFPRGQSRDGTLQVNIRSGRGPEMQMMIPAIIENCNAVFGYAAVARITITQVAMDATMKGAPPEPAAPFEHRGTKKNGKNDRVKKSSKFQNIGANSQLSGFTAKWIGNQIPDRIAVGLDLLKLNFR